jgi:surface antigen
LKGNRIGNMLDGDEKARANAAARRAAASGQPIEWQKTDMLFRTAASGSARPVGRTYRDPSGQLCRRIDEQVRKDGKTEKDTVTFCKGANGWVAPASEQAKAPVIRDPAR